MFRKIPHAALRYVHHGTPLFQRGIGELPNWKWKLIIQISMFLLA